MLEEPTDYKTAMKETQTTSNMTASSTMTVREATRGKTLLLTGATGFLAKVFLERMLRSFPEVEKIYLLIRSANQEHSLDRMELDIFSSSVFQQMKTDAPERFSKICRDKIRFVSGDHSKPRLGLRPDEQLRLQAEVDFVVNVAASTDFMDRLDDAVMTNSLSVVNLSEFVRTSKKARLLHVSTCYVSESETQNVLEGAPLQPPHAKTKLPWVSKSELDIDKTISQISELVESTKKKYEGKPEKQTQALVQVGYRFAQDRGWYNIYTFTKWLGERRLIQEKVKFHCTIIRPSIVGSCLYEPIPGWIEGMKVADPLFYGYAAGLIKSFPGNAKARFDLIPVDFVSNAMLLALAELAAQKKPEIKFYQVCSSEENPLTLAEILRIMRKVYKPGDTSRFYVSKYAFFADLKSLLFFQGLGFSGLKVLKALRILPKVQAAVILKKAKSMQKNLLKLLHFGTIYTPYTNLKCSYDNRQLLDLHSRAAPEDRVQFPVSARRIDWENYLGHVHVPGLIKFVVQADSITPADKPKESNRRKLAK
jgi:alcohol-forming fatty acyl-CoA reductase